MDLQFAFQEVSSMQKFILSSKPKLESLVFSNEFIAFFELKNLIELSLIVIESAIERRESRGSHLRTDFPEKNSNYDRF